MKQILGKPANPSGEIVKRSAATLSLIQGKSLNHKGPHAADRNVRMVRTERRGENRAGHKGRLRLYVSPKIPQE